jgi:hypothetical protein
LALADGKHEHAHFRFDSLRILDGFDVYNNGKEDATVTLRCPELREVSYTVKPGELKHVRTSWVDRSSLVTFDFEHGDGLLFDNFAWRME